MNSRDVLNRFSPLRQAGIIRKYLVAETRCLPHQAEPVPAQIYRSPGEIRVAVIDEINNNRSNWERLSAMNWFPCSPSTYPPAKVARPSKATSWRRRAFDELVTNLGPQCSACGLYVGSRIDHDHFTGDVRGLLCLHCNPVIDECLHPGSHECFAAKYLNSWPALGLGLKYPTEHLVKRLDRIRCHILGFNILDVRCWPSEVPAEWQWTAPPPGFLGHLGAVYLREFRNEWNQWGSELFGHKELRSSFA